MQDVPNSTSKLNDDLDDILDPDERTNDIDEERRPAEHEGEFYDGDRDQDGDTMPLPPISKTNGVSSGGAATSIAPSTTDGNAGNGSGSNEGSGGTTK